jgi:predicted acylesterase/phospholipase RssA
MSETQQKIGLALSGGGFRASIFHLGVIRRLEELGIMKDVSVISTVSGGSIIGAYYVCEMERRLRTRRGELATKSPDAVRLEVFEEIAAGFFRALDHNIRSRALVFAPFYHPLHFIRSFWPGYTRSDIVQGEYDYFFYHGDTLDQLPSVTHGRADVVGAHLTGPKLVINTTSLLTGERKAFSREPISGWRELKKVNTNVLPLSRIVGASASVPGLFPPTWVSGDMLVDGGVSDNQGVDGLLAEGREDDGNTELSKADYDLIIASDASGQMELVHRQKPKTASVLPRVFSIFQHELRNKELGKLQSWAGGGETKDAAPKVREFAFVHLFLNLKDRPNVLDRIPSEYIEALGRIRTDLDQFSLVEREALMYHGYTQIDAQLREHCKAFLKGRQIRTEQMPPMRVPPLFAAGSQQTGAQADSAGGADHRDLIRKELRAGADASFLLRSVKRHGVKAAAIILTAWLVPLVLFVDLFAVRRVGRWAYVWVGARMGDWFDAHAPFWLRASVDWTAGFLRVPITTEGAAVLLSIVVAGYLLLFATYLLMRWVVVRWERTAYRRQSGSAYSTRW